MEGKIKWSNVLFKNSNICYTSEWPMAYNEDLHRTSNTTLAESTSNCFMNSGSTSPSPYFFITRTSHWQRIDMEVLCVKKPRASEQLQSASDISRLNSDLRTQPGEPNCTFWGALSAILKSAIYRSMFEYKQNADLVTCIKSNWHTYLCVKWLSYFGSLFWLQSKSVRQLKHRDLHMLPTQCSCMFFPHINHIMK